MEILVVISIITLMAVVAISATNTSSAATASKQGAVIASNVLALARSVSVENQAYSFLIIDANQDPGNPGHFLHRMMVAGSGTTGTSGVPSTTVTNQLTQVTSWYDLPTGVHFDPAWSAPATTVPLTITNASGGTVFNGSAYVYTFTPAGQLASVGQIVLAVGHEASPSSVPVFEDGTSGTPDTRQGFYLHLLGRPSFFPIPSSIPTTTH